MRRLAVCIRGSDGRKVRVDSAVNNGLWGGPFLPERVGEDTELGRARRGGKLRRRAGVPPTPGYWTASPSILCR